MRAEDTAKETDLYVFIREEFVQQSENPRMERHSCAQAALSFHSQFLSTIKGENLVCALNIEGNLHAISSASSRSCSLLQS